MNDGCFWLSNTINSASFEDSRLWSAMEREIEARRPAQSNSDGLSKTAKVFFGLNIFQVIAIGGIQSAMIAFGNFTFVSKGGLGPGRRVYMALFLLAVLYSCFLCLFAVKRQNFLEILAFVLQNYAYIIYSGIQGKFLPYYSTSRNTMAFID